jgi:hypothetical protein
MTVLAVQCYMQVSQPTSDIGHAGSLSGGQGDPAVGLGHQRHSLETEEIAHAP